MRDGNPANAQNWSLVCSACGAEFAAGENVALDADGHFGEQHPDLDHPHFNLVWVGKGPRPKGGMRRHPQPRRRRR